LQTSAGVLLKLSLKGMPPGEHAVQVHAVGKCEPPSFDSAGPHFNPGNTHHGIMAGPGHAGDMPNLHIPPSGSLEVELVNAAITIDMAKPNSVFHPDGTAVVIHGGKDDYMTDPAGNSGNRIACGEPRPDNGRPNGAIAGARLLDLIWPQVTKLIAIKALRDCNVLLCCAPRRLRATHNELSFECKEIPRC
jgi:Cu-Zn family superoxide dismutase